MLAPASKAAWVLSTCSDTVIGTAGFMLFRGKDPVIATQIMQGFDIRLLLTGYTLRTLDPNQLADK